MCRKKTLSCLASFKTAGQNKESIAAMPKIGIERSESQENVAEELKRSLLCPCSITAGQK